MFFLKTRFWGVQTASSLRETNELRWGAKSPTSIDGFPGGRRPFGSPKSCVAKNFSKSWVLARGPPICIGRSSILPRSGNRSGLSGDLAPCPWGGEVDSGPGDGFGEGFLRCESSSRRPPRFAADTRRSCQSGPRAGAGAVTFGDTFTSR
jgi:hypothetical protein